MKKVLLIASIALLSTTVQAENSTGVSKAVEAGQETTSNLVQTRINAASDLVIAQSEESNLNLWEKLDANKDGSLSKTEAASSKEVFSGWDRLDANKDGKLDTEEFARFLTLGN